MGSFEDRKATGTVFNIQKYSVHDGPGIRTIVFLNGCPLRCRWCSNPESQPATRQLAYNEGRCITLEKCQRCVQACPHGAISEGETGKPKLNRSVCHECKTLDCVEACPSSSLITYGEEKTVEQVLRIVEQDAMFYSRSGGGMTISGGEPLFQKHFALALIREARLRRIKVAIETCGLVPWEVLEDAASRLNYILFDIKHMQTDKHKEWVGTGNELILENFKKLATSFPNLEILVRTPVIPGFNDTEENTRATAEFIAPYKNVSYEMLQYHRLGTQKYDFLDIPCEMGDVTLDGEVTPRLQALADSIITTTRK